MGKRAKRWAAALLFLLSVGGAQIACGRPAGQFSSGVEAEVDLVERGLEAQEGLKTR